MAPNDRSFKLFGFEIKRADQDDPKKRPSIVPARDDDGAGYVTAAGTHYGQYLNIDGDDAKDNYSWSNYVIDISRVLFRTCLILIGFFAHQSSHAIIVDVQFSGANSSQQALFQQAANYWGHHLIGYQTGINVPNTVTINASIGPDDGPGGTLAYAGPTYVWGQQYTNGYVIIFKMIFHHT